MSKIHVHVSPEHARTACQKMWAQWTYLLQTCRSKPDLLHLFRRLQLQSSERGHLHTHQGQSVVQKENSLELLNSKRFDSSWTRLDLRSDIFVAPLVYMYMCMLVCVSTSDMYAFETEDEDSPLALFSFAYPITNYIRIAEILGNANRSRCSHLELKWYSVRFLWSQKEWPLLAIGTPNPPVAHW